MRGVTESEGGSRLWASGDAYEPYVGRWSRLVAREFLDWIGLAPGLDWLDAGCGTGALTEEVLAGAAPASVLALDSSPGFIAYAERHVTDPRVRFEVGDAQELVAPDASVDAVVAGLMLNFVPEPERAVREAARVLRPGGVAAVYVWDYADGMQLIRRFWDAAVELDPAARELDEGVRYPLCAPEPLAGLFARASLDSVEVRPIDVETRFIDFDDLWSPFLGGQGPAPAYTMSLSDAGREALRERLREALPVGPDGSIELSARAWAARGLR
jgi:SAM-dependent methyltransferase